MAVVPRKLFFQWREEILSGKTVKEIENTSGKGFSASTIRSYTKSERAKMADLKERVKRGEVTPEDYASRVQRRRR